MHSTASLASRERSAARRGAPRARRARDFKGAPAAPGAGTHTRALPAHASAGRSALPARPRRQGIPRGHAGGAARARRYSRRAAVAVLVGDGLDAAAPRHADVAVEKAEVDAHHRHGCARCSARRWLWGWDRPRLRARRSPTAERRHQPAAAPPCAGAAGGEPARPRRRLGSFRQRSGGAALPEGSGTGGMRPSGEGAAPPIAPPRARVSAAEAPPRFWPGLWVPHGPG